MIYIYNPKKWPSAKVLIMAIRDLEGKAKLLTKKIPVPTEGMIVNWGFPHPNAIYNRRIVGNKLKELQKLTEAEVRCPKVSVERVDGWYARLLKHKCGDDLAKNLSVGDYYVEPVPVEREFRVHVLDGKSIKIGLKIPSRANHHSWIRSWKRGWKIEYGTPCQDALTKGVRNQAKKAVEALGLDFGAVDVGVRTDNKAIVFEVNTAPGLDNFPTALAYARHFIAMDL